MVTNYRIKSRIRFTLFVAAAIISLTAAVNFALGLSTADSSTIQEYIEVKISSGDTLWSIAETYMPDSQDIRRSVYELCKINDITASELYAGMTVTVPV